MHLLGLRLRTGSAPSGRCGTPPSPAWPPGCAPDLERLVSTWRGRPPLWRTSSTKLRAPASDAAPAGLEGALERGRVGRQEVRRGQRVDEQAAGESGLARGRPVQPRRPPAGPRPPAARGRSGGGRRSPGSPPTPDRRTAGPRRPGPPGPRRCPTRRATRPPGSCGSDPGHSAGRPTRRLRDDEPRRRRPRPAPVRTTQGRGPRAPPPPAPGRSTRKARPRPTPPLRPRPVRSSAGQPRCASSRHRARISRTEKSKSRPEVGREDETVVAVDVEGLIARLPTRSPAWSDAPARRAPERLDHHVRFHPHDKVRERRIVAPPGTCPHLERWANLITNRQTTGAIRRRQTRARDLPGRRVDPLGGDLRSMLIESHYDPHKGPPQAPRSKTPARTSAALELRRSLYARPDRPGCSCHLSGHAGILGRRRATQHSVGHTSQFHLAVGTRRWMLRCPGWSGETGVR